MSILECNHVSICYMTGDFRDIGLKEYVMRKIRGDYHVQEFWADKDVTFKLDRGDMLGIIGSNGAGKSTLLKAITGIMVPTEGSVHREGNIAALLELASGFDGDLTVRENAYLRGAMLGYTREFMNEMYERIIDFSELQEFQERPFKQLSSGMKSRLAFAIASLVNPDILILDEVLSVGDGAFRKKSEEKMREIIGSGATTILVSHSLEQVRSLCNKVLWLEKGKQIAFGDTQVLCNLYQMFLDKEITLDEAKKTLAMLNDHYDWLIVGAGFSGATFAHEMWKRGKKCLVIDQQSEIAGCAHCEKEAGVTVHVYGPHIFHTNNKEIWDYAARCLKYSDTPSKFLPYQHKTYAKLQEQYYPIPFNMTTFEKFWGITDPEEAQRKIEAARENIPEPKNFEEAALAAVGRELYETFIRPPVEKDWGCPAKQLPASLLDTVLRFDDREGVYDDLYQGVPAGGYDSLISFLLKNKAVVTGMSYDKIIHAFPNIADHILFTGSIDSFYNYSLGRLEYRTMRIEREVIEEKNFQGRAEVIHCDPGTDHTRTIEYKHISGEDSRHSMVQRIYPSEWGPGKPRFYPRGDAKNRELYERYTELWKKYPKGLPPTDAKKAEELGESYDPAEDYDLSADPRPDVVFGGRLGTYRFLTMAEAMEEAIRLAEEISAAEETAAEESAADGTEKKD